MRFTEGVATSAREAGVVAIDGKGLRCAFERARGGSPLALVNAFASASGLALGQVGVPHGGGEIAALRALLDLLDLNGAIVTADAIHCQRETAQAILDKGADYVLSLKANRFAMYDDAVLFLNDPDVIVADVAETVDADHGRIEPRRARVIHDVAWLAERYTFPGLCALVEVIAIREQHARTTTSRRLYILSKPVSAAQALAAVRAHWSIENQLHWVLDVVFDEDRARARTDHAPLNLAVLRRLALNIARTNPAKASIRGKIKRADGTTPSSQISSSKCDSPVAPEPDLVVPRRLVVPGSIHSGKRQRILEIGQLVAEQTRIIFSTLHVAVRKAERHIVDFFPDHLVQGAGIGGDGLPAGQSDIAIDRVLQVGNPATLDAFRYHFRRIAPRIENDLGTRLEAILVHCSTSTRSSARSSQRMTVANFSLSRG
jgi:predicted transposase YbfD/YdcC